MLTADLYFSFRSPYSYLAIGRYRALMESHVVEIALRPVWPLAIREPDFFERNHPNWLGYTVRDMMRVAQFHGIPFGPPRPDPIVQDVATRRIAQDQPFIRYVTRMGQAAARRGKGVAFAHEAAQLIWGGAENWHEGDHLANAAQRAGLDPAALDAEIAAQADTRRGDRRQPAGAGRGGPLGRADAGVRWRTLLRAGPDRDGPLADGAERAGSARLARAR